MQVQFNFPLNTPFFVDDAKARGNLSSSLGRVSESIVDKNIAEKGQNSVDLQAQKNESTQQNRQAKYDLDTAHEPASTVSDKESPATETLDAENRLIALLKQAILARELDTNNLDAERNNETTSKRAADASLQQERIFVPEMPMRSSGKIAHDLYQQIEGVFASRDPHGNLVGVDEVV